MRSIVVFLFTVILLSSLNFAATYAVNGTGNSCFAGAAGNFSTIQAAINAAADGDTVIVCANGSSAYTENVNVIRSINLYGNQTRLLVAAVNDSAPVFRVNSTYVNITNFTLSGATSSMGIWLNETSSYVRIFNVNLTNNSRGVYVFGSLNNNISNNFLNNNSAYGIEISTSSNNNRVENNTIDHSRGSGGGLHIGQAHNNTILLNTVFNATNWNMFTALAHNNTIVNNTFNTSASGIILQSSNTNIFANNTIVGNTLQGLQIQGSASNNISSNIFGNSSGIGIYMYSASSSGNRIYSNTIANFTGGAATGIYVNETNVVLHIYGNTLSNNTYGIYLNRANSTNITSNTVFNNSYGFSLSSTSNNTLTSNSASNTFNGFYLYSSSNNTLTSNIAYNSSNIGFYVDTSTNNNLTNNIVNYSSSGFYIYANSNNNTLISNSAYNNSNLGFYLSSSSNNILTSNIAYNNSQPNFALSSSSNNTLTSNTASYSNYGFHIISNSNNNTFVSNTAYNHSTAGFALFTNSSNNNLTTNNAYNNSEYGFDLSSSSNNTLTNNTASGGSLSAFYLDWSSRNNTLTSNTASTSPYGFTIDTTSNNNVFLSNSVQSISYSCFYLLNQSTNNSFTSNTVSNCSTGFELIEFSSSLAFSGNNITNTTVSGILLNQSNITFTGNNGVYLGPSPGVEIYLINNSVFNTSLYNLTTINLNFQVYSINNSIKTLNLSNVSGANFTTLSSISGVSFSSAKIVQNSNGNYYGLNVSNTSASALFSPKLFYNSSDLTGYSTSYLGVGSTSSAGSWTYRSSTVNTSESSVYYSGITSFSYFAPLVYSPSSDSSSDNDQSNPSNPSLTISYSTSCEQNTVKVKSGGSAVSGATVKVDGDSIGLTDSNGQVTFAGCGKDVIISATKSGYTHDYLTATLVACSQCTPQLECTLNTECNANEFCSNNVCVQVTGTCGYISDHAWVSYQCCVNSDCSVNQECKEHVCVAEQSPSTKAEAAIAEAENAINKAKSEGKNVTTAQNKLNEAKAAFAEENYDEAESLAKWAVNFANSAIKPTSEPVTPPVNSTPSPQPNPSPTPQPTKPLFDFGLLLFLVPVVIIVGLIALYLVFGTKKKYGKNQ